MPKFNHFCHLPLSLLQYNQPGHAVRHARLQDAPESAREGGPGLQDFGRRCSAPGQSTLSPPENVEPKRVFCSFRNGKALIPLLTAKTMSSFFLFLNFRILRCALPP